MSALREHFFEKYFAYRARYVARVGECAPHRTRWAVASEVARLSFVFLACGVCALVLWLPAASAFEKGSGWTVVFVACAVPASLFAVAALFGALHAARLLARSEGGERRNL